MEVIKFNPIWKLNIVPTIFIIYIKAPPKIEFIDNLHILFNGNINIFPIIKIKNIQASIVIKLLVSKVHPPIKYSSFYTICYTLDKYSYPTSFLFSNLKLVSFTISSISPFFFIFFSR